MNTTIIFFLNQPGLVSLQTLFWTLVWLIFTADNHRIICFLFSDECNILIWTIECLRLCSQLLGENFKIYDRSWTINLICYVVLRKRFYCGKTMVVVAPLILRLAYWVFLCSTAYNHTCGRIFYILYDRVRGSILGGNISTQEGRRQRGGSTRFNPLLDFLKS